MNAAAGHAPCPSGRPTRSSKDREPQKSRSTGRQLQEMMKCLSALDEHRACRPTKLRAALVSVLKGGTRTNQMTQESRAAPLAEHIPDTKLRVRNAGTEPTIIASGTWEPLEQLPRAAWLPSRNCRITMVYAVFLPTTTECQYHIDKREDSLIPLLQPWGQAFFGVDCGDGWIKVILPKSVEILTAAPT